MDHHSFWNHYPAEDDLPGGIHGFDLIFRNFFRVISKKCMGGDYNILESILRSGRPEEGLLGGSGIREDFCTRNFQIFIAFFGNTESILCIRLIFRRGHTIFQRGSGQNQFRDLTAGICIYLLDHRVRISTVRNRDRGIIYRLVSVCSKYGKAETPLVGTFHCLSRFH